MKEMRDKILLLAIEGIENGTHKESLEEIMMAVTYSNSDKSVAYAKGLEMKIKATGVTVDDVNLKHLKAKYGYYKNYPVIQLALDQLQMTKESFVMVYGFEYKLKDKVAEEVEQLISDIKFKRHVLKSYNIPDVSSLKTVFEAFSNG